MASKTATAKKKAPKNKLVIVESPAKAKTIEKYLGKGFVVKASMGHLIDLPKSRIAIDVDNNFVPEYITVRGRAKLLKELQSDAKKSSEVLLASDNDREGEAIAWHLRNSILSKYEVPVHRIVFNEITPQAIKEAIKHPMDIDESKVNAQKARRVLDRLVGYNLSPLLWKKVKNGLSAGRVQSVALRLICEREKEVESFIPEEYWTLDGDFKRGKNEFTAQLVQFRGEKPELPNEAAVQAIMETLNGKPASVLETKSLDKTIRPKPPFTTSKLQQMAANRLGYTSKKTMQIAQQLYEGINIGSTRVGLITYMRTDSVRIAATAVEEVRAWIGEKYPDELPEAANEYAVGKKAQDAHEAIRPTYTKYTPDYVKEYLTRDQLRLYSIIWERFVSSQMANAKSRTVSTDIAIDEAVFRVSSTKIVEKGFYQVIKTLAAKEDRQKPLPDMKSGETVDLVTFHPEQHFTQGPARYTDASIVKTLEEKGIGRPSTYAPIISVLLDRYYVTRSNKQLVPTQLGRIINDMLVEYFSSVVDVSFTANVENELDGVEEDRIEWPKMIGEFYFPFKKRVDEVTETLDSVKGTLDEKTDYVCEKCGKPMLKNSADSGFFSPVQGSPSAETPARFPWPGVPVRDVTEKLSRAEPRDAARNFTDAPGIPSATLLRISSP